MRHFKFNTTLIFDEKFGQR